MNEKEFETYLEEVGLKMFGVIIESDGKLSDENIRQLKHFVNACERIINVSEAKRDMELIKKLYNEYNSKKTEA